MKLKKLLLCGGMFAVASSQAALTVTERVLPLPDPAKATLATDNATVQYLYNVGTQSYFMGGQPYDTRACVNMAKGFKVKVEDLGGMYAIRDSVEKFREYCKMFAGGPSDIYVDNNNGANVDAWVFDQAADGTFVISNPAAADGVFGAEKGEQTEKQLFLYPQDRENFSYTWYAVTEEEYTTNVALRADILATNDALKRLWAVLVEADEAGVPGLAQYEAVYADETATAETIGEAADNVKQAIIDFRASKGTAAEPADMSSMIENRTFDVIGNFDGWSGDKFSAGGTTSTCAEHYNKTFDTWQKFDNVPNGVWALTADGFYRYSGSWDDHVNKRGGRAKLYAMNIKADEALNDTLTSSVMTIYDGIEAGNNTVSPDNTQTDTHDGENYTVPSTMKGATNYFDAGYYKDNKVLFAVTEGSMRIGVKKPTKENNDWTIFDNFGLKYYGNGADAYQLLNDDVLSQAPVYNADDVQVSTVALEEYNEVRDAAAKAATYEDVMKNKAAVEAAQAAVEANIAAWAAYQKELELAKGITGNPNYTGDDVAILSDYVEFEAQDKIESRELTTEGVIAETATLKELRENAQQNSITPGTDFTDRIQNPEFADGWNGWGHKGNGGNVAANSAAKCAEAWNSSDFDIWQEIEGAPVGCYEVSVQGFYRRGRGDNAWKFYFDEATGLPKPTVPETPAYVYLNDNKTPLANVFEYSVPEAENYYTGDYYTGPEVNGQKFTYPNNMADAGLAFNHEAYKVSAFGLVAKKGDPLRIGMKGTTTQEGDSWAIFTRFNLVYQGYKAEILQPELEKAIAAIDLTQPMGADVKSNTETLIQNGNGAIATADGREMFNALAAIYSNNDSIEQSVKLFAAIQTNIDDLNNIVAESEAAQDVKEEVANYLAEVTLEGKTNAEAEEISAKLAECRYKLSLPAGYENATDAEPVDMTALILSAGFEKDGANSSEGWQGFDGSFGNNDTQKAALAAEWYHKKIDLYQDIVVPNGTYQVSVNAFCSTEKGYDDYVAGVASPAVFYATSGETTVEHAIENRASDINASTEPIGQGSEQQYTNNDGVKYNMPNDVVSSVAYFDQGRYVNGVNIKVTDGKLRVGVRCDKDDVWVAMDNFRLLYLGTNSSAEENGWNDVKGVESAGEVKSVKIYTADGVEHATLQKGVNIVVTADAEGNVTSKTVLVK